MKVNGRGLVVAVACTAAMTMVAAACSSGGGKPKIAGDVTVNVVDSLGKPQAGLEVVSSARGVILAEGKTDGSGNLTIGVAKGGELTSYRKIPSAYETRTLFDVSPGGTVQLPAGFYVGGPSTVTMTMSSTTSLGAATDGEFFVGYGNTNCRSPATFGSPTAMDVDTLCLQTDGTYTVTALLYGTAGGLAGYSVTPDVSLVDGGTLDVAVHGTSSEISTDIARDVTGIPLPSSGGNDLESFVYFTRKGQGFGSFYGVTGSGATFASIHATGDPLYSAALADGLYSYLYMTNVDGTYFADAQSTTLTSVSVDASKLPVAPTSVAVFGGSSPSIKIADPAGQAMDSFADITWKDGAGTKHVWFGWSPPPSGAGTRKVVMPPVPDDEAAFAVTGSPSFTGHAGYYDEGARPADWHSAPDPFLPEVLTGSYSRWYAERFTTP